MSESTLYTPSGTAPLFVKNSLNAISQGQRKLIVIQLNGGNDGLNTIVPYRNDIYYNARPTLSIKKNKIIDINGDVGFHKSMKVFADLFNRGLVSVINRVGYPNASRSHFKSMDFWQGGGNFKTGWLGRYLDTIQMTPDTMPAVEISDVLTRVLRGETNKGVAFDDLEELHHDISNPLVNEAIRLGRSNQIQNNDNLEYIYNVITSGKDFIDPAYEKYSHRPELTQFPDTDFGNQLKLIAGMIASGVNTGIYYATHGTFDTHVGQDKKHSRLLQTLSDAVGSLVASLEQTNHFQDTCILIFSEFGRRVKENGGKGTDHGAGNSMYVISPNLKTPGFFNNYDPLTELVKGDLPFDIDFRQIYAGILEDWLGAESEHILKKRFNKLDLFSDRVQEMIS